ncbi:hypothetical protein DL764_000644 [Monosporascus ibericus]|uniref:PH domain-containing protein n=1 Tax=Monosporascus ibericus TaxID=155417 RepID=A0A4Q4TST7_9PEZI|nr:hypothetical protein DL764_000644 [Monosporascus ibericus]
MTGTASSIPRPTGTSSSGSATVLSIPRSATAGPTRTSTSHLRNHLSVAASSPVNLNGSFEFDRVIKSGYVQRRTQKTKTWKPVYLVLRPNALSLYKTDKESKLRQKVYLSDLSAVTLLKDPKQKRHNLFGLFSPARNFHFEAPTQEDAQEWVDLIRKDARIEEEEEEMFLASPIVRRQSFAPAGLLGNKSERARHAAMENERFLSSSPEPVEVTTSRPKSGRRPSHNVESSGFSGNELASHSDFSDTDIQRNHGVSIESLAVQPLSPSGAARFRGSLDGRPSFGNRNASQISGLNLEQDPDRVLWQGWLMFLKSKGGVRQWKNYWAVLRLKNLIFYKDKTEYAASRIIDMSTVVNVVDIDPVSKTKIHCMQIITDEKSYRLCARDEETLLQCLGAFKSLLSKRRELEVRVSTSGNL